MLHDGLVKINTYKDEAKRTGLCCQNLFVYQVDEMFVVEVAVAS